MNPNPIIGVNMKIHIFEKNGKIKKVVLELDNNIQIRLPPKYLVNRKTLYNPITQCYIPLTKENVVYHKN